MNLCYLSSFSFSSNRDEIEISKIFSKVIDDLSNDGIVLGMMNLDYEQKLKVSNICLSPFIQLMKNDAKKRKIQILNIKVISTEVKEGEATVKVEGNIIIPQNVKTTFSKSLFS